jgi:hypothetical protein
VNVLELFSHAIEAMNVTENAFIAFAATSSWLTVNDRLSLAVLSSVLQGKSKQALRLGDGCVSFLRKASLLSVFLGLPIQFLCRRRSCSLIGAIAIAFSRRAFRLRSISLRTITLEGELSKSRVVGNP